jgi:hypothetical protein
MRLALGCLTKRWTLSTSNITMFARNGTTLFVLAQTQVLDEQCGKLYLYRPLDPFEYVVDGGILYRFTLDDFLLALDREEQAHFVEVVEQSVPATRRFVTEHVDVAKDVARFTADVSPALEAPTCCASAPRLRRLIAPENPPQPQLHSQNTFNPPPLLYTAHHHRPFLKVSPDFFT